MKSTKIFTKKKLLQRQNINNRINSRSTPATALKFGTFVLIPNFITQRGILKKLQPLRKKSNDKHNDATYKLTDSSIKENVQHRNKLLPYYPKEYALRDLSQLYFLQVQKLFKTIQILNKIITLTTR